MNFVLAFNNCLCLLLHKTRLMELRCSWLVALTTVVEGNNKSYHGCSFFLFVRMDGWMDGWKATARSPTHQCLADAPVVG
jgi:hypothetical protein